MPRFCVNCRYHPANSPPAEVRSIMDKLGCQHPRAVFSGPVDLVSGQPGGEERATMMALRSSPTLPSSTTPDLPVCGPAGSWFVAMVRA